MPLSLHPANENKELFRGKELKDLVEEEPCLAKQKKRCLFRFIFKEIGKLIQKTQCNKDRKEPYYFPRAPFKPLD